MRTSKHALYQAHFAVHSPAGAINLSHHVAIRQQAFARSLGMALGRWLAQTAAAWAVFFGGSVVIQVADYTLRDASVADGEKLLHARLQLSECVFVAWHAWYAVASIALAFIATRGIPWVALRIAIVMVETAVVYVVFALMMLSYACRIGDCL